ncbi:MAG: GWxTD domain-containing protein [Ignavibacteriales bacterium]|nr:GWxTD domain-containing protein [Ignavibacteriales bacterium]
MAKLPLFLLLTALSLPLSGIDAQPVLRNINADAVPTFFFEAISFSSEQVNKSHVDIYLQVPHEELRFVKEGDIYLARYEVNVGVYTPEKELVQDRSWTVEVREKDFAQTTSSRQSSLTQRGIELEAGNYEFVVKMEDQDSRRSAQIRRSMLISNYAKDTMTVSDIMLVSRLTTEGEKKKIVPNISGNVGHLSEGFFLFFEIYNAGTEDSLELVCRVYNSKKEQVYERLERHASLGLKTQSFFKVENLHLPVGTYLVAMEVSPVRKDAAAGILATTTRTFTVRWSDIPASVTDLDKAIDQMRYIARDSELEEIRSSGDLEEKRKRFLDFWTKRDPDPTTPRNELLDEYYRRVELANKSFTHYLEGWRTDRGMVYIRLGPPENIERHPFDINTKPYEIWYYYQLQREFVFVDETGFGDYRLKYPTTDLWGRIR